MLDKFLITMKRFEPSLKTEAGGKIAIAVSGGPDSLALCGLIRDWNNTLKIPLEIHALTVDHRLRPEAAEEALMVQSQLSDWHHFHHSTLLWHYDKVPDSRLLEQARQARYDLIETYCNDNSITYLCVAHHSEDQAETVLFRLCKGSGIDGLGAMKPFKKRGSLTLFRPLLDYTKEDLIEYCHKQDLNYSNDPTNNNNSFARIRLRQSLPMLDKEGLSVKRLNILSKRMQRASSALDYYTDKSLIECILLKDTIRIDIDFKKFSKYPEEIIFRLLKRCIEDFNINNEYGVRTERIENIVYDLLHNQPFRARTLAGLKLSLKDNILQMKREG